MVWQYEILILFQANIVTHHHLEKERKHRTKVSILNTMQSVLFNNIHAQLYLYTSLIFQSESVRFFSFPEENLK